MSPSYAYGKVAITDNVECQTCKGKGAVHWHSHIKKYYCGSCLAIQENPIKGLIIKKVEEK